jgi:hypothetical protein
MNNILKTLFPLFIWLAWVVLLGPEFRQNHWEGLLVMFAAIELMPRGLRLLDLPQGEGYTFCALAFCAAWFFDEYWWLALPYLFWAVWNTLNVAFRLLWLQPRRRLDDFVRLFALGYWTTGAVFALLYLANIRPLGFDPVIISLTAAHFHVAGFVLSVLVWMQIRYFPGRFSHILGVLSLLGMPLVAAGITGSQLGFAPGVEQAAAAFFILYAFLLAGMQFRRSFAPQTPVPTRWLWRTGSVCLWAGAVLAGAYALRFQWPLEWVSIPNMKYWHGTLNALGFAWLSLLGYKNDLA